MSSDEIIAKIKAEKKYTSDPDEKIKSFISEYNQLFYDCNDFMNKVLTVSKPLFSSLKFENFPTLELTTDDFVAFSNKYSELQTDDIQWHSYCKTMYNIIFNAKNIKELIDGYFKGTPEKKEESIEFINNNSIYKERFPILAYFKGGKPKKTRCKKNKKRRSSRRHKK